MNSETHTGAAADRATMRERLRDVELLDQAVVVVVDRTPDGQALTRLMVPVGGARRSGSLRFAGWPEAFVALREVEGRRGFHRARMHRVTTAARAGRTILKWGEDLPFDDPVACGFLYGYADAAIAQYAKEQSGGSI